MKLAAITLALFAFSALAENRTGTAEYLAFEATLDVEKVLARTVVDENAQVYDIAVLVTTEDSAVLAKRTQPVIEVTPGVWKYLGSRVENYVAPTAVPNAKELLYNGRQVLLALRDNAIPIPAAATEAMPLVVSESDWHGRIISKYKVRKDAHSVAGVPGSVLHIWLEVDGGLDEKVTCFIWVTDAGQYIVDPYED